MTTFHLMHAPEFSEERDAQAEALLTMIPDLCLHSDQERVGPLAMLGTILQCPRQDDEWTVILQDDAHPLPDWERHLTPALENSPRPVVSLGHFGSYGKRLVARGLPYGEGVNGVWGYAWAYRADMRAALLDLVSFAVSVGWNPMSDDGAVIALNLLLGQKTAMTSRALFDHDTSWRSTLGHGSKVRFPQSTIREPGPWWGIRGAGAIGTNSRPDDVLELIAAWTEANGNRLPGDDA